MKSPSEKLKPKNSKDFCESRNKEIMYPGEMHDGTVTPSNDVTCIIGMHRSGTSMITRLLNLCGLELGTTDQLVEPLDDNPLGFFESKGFLKINQNLLAHFGGSLYDPPCLEEGWEYKPSLEQIIDEAKSLLKTFSKNSQWGWKDPRTTILLPFWKSLIPNLRFVICVRSPLDVAKSLARRDRISIERGICLWNQYMEAAIRDTEGCPRIFTFYEDYFDDDSGELDKLTDFCKLQKPDDISVLNDTIFRQLRHHASETYELLNEEKLPTEHKLLYIGLRALTTDGFVHSTLYRSQDILLSKCISQFFKLLERFHDQHEVARLQSVIAEGQKDRDLQRVKIENLEGRIAERETHICNLTERVENLKKESKNKDAQIENKQSHINGLTAHAGNLEKVIAQKENHINDLMKHTGNLEKNLTDKENHMISLIKDGDNLKKKLADKEEYITSLVKHVGNLEKNLADKEERNTGLMKHADNLEKSLADKESHMTNLMKCASNLEKAIADKEGQIDILEKSIREKNFQISSLKDFEKKIKKTLLYKVFNQAISSER